MVTLRRLTTTGTGRRSTGSTGRRSTDLAELRAEEGPVWFQNNGLGGEELHLLRVKHPLRKRQSPREMSYFDVVVWDSHTGALLQT